MKLYRGDSLPSEILSADRKSRGRTFANYFCGNGLMAKFADGGTSRLLARKNLRRLVEEHVGYAANSDAEALSLHSPMLSFTSSRERAFAFCERREKKRARLEECPFDVATHFVWELDVQLPAPKEPGLYDFHYRSNPKNCLGIVEDQLRCGIAAASTTGDLSPLMGALATGIAVNYAQSDQTMYYAQLIDVVSFLLSDGVTGSDPVLLSNARGRASRDLEWLLYPCDLLDGGKGLSAQFRMNAHLKVLDCFKVVTDAG